MEFAKSAERDLDHVLEWYAAQQVPEVGRRLVTSVVKQVEQLELFPDSGRVVPEFDIDWLRELLLPPFRIVYRHIGDTVGVVRVRRSERLMDPGVRGNAQHAHPTDS